MSYFVGCTRNGTHCGRLCLGGTLLQEMRRADLIVAFAQPKKSVWCCCRVDTRFVTVVAINNDHSAIYAAQAFGIGIESISPNQPRRSIRV